MAETSSMIPLGTLAPDFRLLDVCTQQFFELRDVEFEKALVIMFICNHCPYVQIILPRLILLANQYLAKGVRFVAISSNDVNTYPEDGPAQMQLLAKQHSFPFPYLYDETQATAKAYHAVCTPDFFIFDRALKCVYRGRFDDATPKNRIPPSGCDLMNALDQLLKGETVSTDQKPSIGCSIKWKDVAAV